MIDSPDSSWYVVQTHSRAEEKATIHLRRQGYDVYFPRYLKKRRHARKVETVPVALFPRYLFVTIDRMTQRWRSIQSTIGVTRLVCNGDEPAVVPSGVVNELRRREGEDGFIQLDLRPRFARGDKIQIVAGVLFACCGLFEEMADQERVAVLLDLLGRKVRVVLDMESVAAA